MPVNTVKVHWLKGEKSSSSHHWWGEGRWDHEPQVQHIRAGQAIAQGHICSWICPYDKSENKLEALPPCTALKTILCRLWTSTLCTLMRYRKLTVKGRKALCLLHTEHQLIPSTESIKIIRWIFDEVQMHEIASHARQPHTRKTGSFKQKKKKIL